VEILNRLRVPTLVCCEERQIEAAGWVLDKAHLIIDILLGMEFQGQLRPPVQRLIERINQAHAGGPKVMAVDIPSGLGYDPRTTAGAVIQADLTATLVAPKSGMLVETARPYIGKVTLIDMGFPHELLPRE